MSVPMRYMIRAAFPTVTVSRIPVENAGNLRERSIVASRMPHHVAREEADMAAIHLLGHPKHFNCLLLLSIHHQLHHMEADNNILLQHLVPAQLVLLARAAPAAHLQPYKNLHKGARSMDRRMDLRLYCYRNLGIIKKNGRVRHVRRGRRRSNLLCRCACRGKCDVVGHTFAARSLELVDESDGGRFLLPGARNAATAAGLGTNTEYEHAARSLHSSWCSS